MSRKLRNCLSITIAALAVAAPVTAAHAATISVCASGCDHTTIPAAVTAAQPGDTISVQPGTYSDPVTINKAGLTLRGAQHGTAGTDHPAPSTPNRDLSILPAGADITIGAANVTIDGFELGDGTDAGNDKITDTPGHTGLRVVDNVITGGRRGIWITSGGAASITGNLFVANIDATAGNSGAQAAIWTDASHDIQISSNTFQDEVDATAPVNGMTAINLSTGETNDSVVGNTFTNVDSAVVLVGGDHIDISRNTGSGFNGSAIFLGLDNKNVWVTANTLSQGGAMLTSGVRLSSAFGNGANAPSTGIHVLGNSISGFANGLRAADDSGPAIGADITAHLNDLSGNANAIKNDTVAGAIDAESNFLGTAPVTITAGGTVDATNPLLAASGSTTTLVAAADPTADTHGCGSAANPCDDVQAGIDNAITGGTVQIADGTYTGQFDVWRAMTLAGASKAGTILRSPAHGTQVPTITVGGADQYPVLTLRAGTLSTTVQTLTVDGSNTGADADCSPNLDGIAIVDASATVQDAVVEHVRLLPQATLGGCQAGRAIYGRDTQGFPRTITVSNTTVSDYQKNGIDLRGNGLTVSVAGNTVTDTADPAIASNGIIVASGAGGSISTNTVSGNACDVSVVCTSDPLSTQSFGILVFDNEALTISGNTLSGNDAGLYAGELAGPTPDHPLTTISANTITGNRYEGLVVDAGRTAVSANTISGGNIGVRVTSFTGDDFDSDVTLTNNTISSPTGLDVYDDDPSDNVRPVVTSHHDSLAGSPAAVNNETTHAVDATDDWFGCSGGPGAVGCSTVGGAGDVDTSPNLVLAVSAPATLQTGAAAASVFASLRQNSEGDTFSGGPSGASVSVSADLGSIAGSPATMTNGLATVTFTPGATPGLATITASLGTQQATGTVSVVAPTPPSTTTVTTTTPAQTVTTAGQTITIPAQTVTAPVTAQGPTSDSKTVADASAQALAGAGTARLTSIENVDVFGKVAGVTAKSTGKAPVFALGCVTGACRVALKFQVRYHDVRNHLHTLAVPSQTIVLKAGAAKLVTVSLNSAARKALAKAHGLTLKVTIGVTDPVSHKVFAVSKTFALKLATS